MKNSPIKPMAVAMLSLTLTACASSPIVPEGALDSASDRISSATERLTDAGSSAWQRAKHVLRLDGSPPRPPGSPLPRGTNTDEFLDEVDLALMEDGLPDLDNTHQDITLSSAQIEHAIKTAELPADTVAMADPLLPSSEPSVPTNGNALPPVELNRPEPISQPMLADAEEPELLPGAGETPTSGPVVVSDYQHKVGEQEILWDIAKKFTGDATNWRILAELNELDANGSVRVGQLLNIPADMLKPEWNSPTGEASATTAAAETVMPATSSGTTDGAVEEPALAASKSVPEIPSRDFEVQAGESMWELAKRTTGDATNWKLIADANGMSEKDAGRIYYGQKIRVPEALIRTDRAPSEAVAVASVPVETPAPQNASQSAAQVAEQSTEPQPQTRVIAEAQPVESLPSDQDLTILEASYKAAPMDTTTATVNAHGALLQTPPPAGVDAGNQEEGEWIMVSGTYYPKAIYNDANFSSSLLMRVSPGTRLKVSRAIGPWYEVRTERGFGYVHARDIK